MPNWITITATIAYSERATSCSVRVGRGVSVSLFTSQTIPARRVFSQTQSVMASCAARRRAASGSVTDLMKREPEAVPVSVSSRL